MSISITLKKQTTYTPFRLFALWDKDAFNNVTWRSRILTPLNLNFSQR